MARTWVLYHHFQFQSILSAIETIESLLKIETENQALYGEVDFFRGYCCYFLNEGPRSLKHLQAALDHIPLTHHEIRGQAELVFGLACQMEGQKEKAIHTLNDLIYGDPRPQNMRKTRLLASLVYIHIISADPAEAFKANKELTDVATAGHYSYAKAWSIYLQGLISFYRGEFEKAVHYLSQAHEDRYILHTRAAFDCIAGLVFAHQFLGHPDRADATMERLFEFAGELNDPAYSAIAASCKTRLLLIQGRTGEAVNMLPADETSGVENIFVWLEIPAITHCRVLIAEGSDTGLEQAEKRLQEYLKMNRDNHNTRAIIEILSLLSLVCKMQGKSAEALSLLKHALDLARPGEWVHPFIEPGPPMAELLNMFEKKVADDFTEKILVTCNESQTQVSPEEVPPGPKTPRPQPLVEPLTNRELDILELLAQRLQTKEIAEKLYILSETVKSHLKNIYQKLSVGNRRQAVQKARELGILTTP
jgi:LuxR family maltose regulon positive regulatory protein